jgi:hypothetical protein
MALDVHKEKGPTRVNAGEAFCISEAWQSGLLHRAYPSADPEENDRFAQYSA